jgi:carboxymethylenebutenolidase
MGSFQDITSIDDFVFPAYVAQPDIVPLAAVVVLQEIFGVNAHIKAVADFYASHGYLAVAPSTFHRVKADVNLGYTPADIDVGKDLKAAAEAIQPQVMMDVQAAIDFADTVMDEARSLQVSKRGKVGIVGYCWGGLLTWRAACTLTGLSAAVPYYGAGMTVGAERARQPQCPVLVHFGEQDASIPMDTVKAFISAQPDVDVQIYPANHGFNCDHRGAYNATAAKLAQARTLAFFTTNLVAT